MKKDKVIYWTTTGLIGVMITFSAFSYFANPEVAKGFVHLGFPDYFRIELGIAKLIAAIVLMVPIIPVKVKEWAYIGLAITFISAFVAHAASGDAVVMIVSPIVFLVILIVSNIYLHKQPKAAL